MRGPAYVFCAVLVAESEVSVQAVAQVVPIEDVRGLSRRDQALLEGVCDGGLPRRRQTRHPDDGTALPEHLPALVALDLPRVPRDVWAGSAPVAVPLLAEDHAGA